MREIKIYNELYDAQISYLIGGDAFDLVRFLKKRYGKNAKYWSWDREVIFGDDVNTTDAYQFHVNAPLGAGERFYIWMCQPKPSLVFHETYHLVGDIMHRSGIEYDYKSEETFAYLGGWIYKKIHKLI